MSNSRKKTKRDRARVWSIRKDSGRILRRLTTPKRGRAFFAPVGISPGEEGSQDGYHVAYYPHA